MLGEKNWDKHIPSILFAYRTKKQSSTKIKPFYATYGRKAKLPLDKDENKITLADRVKILVEELPNKWKGPYLIHEEFGNGAYKLKELNGRILKTPQNGEWLKKFYDREIFTPKIVIKEKEIMDKTQV
ncbi:unnamed protein product [Rhizophagus irregularis]|nr:unnamed protein product [Rhizophagus irregularis]